MVVRYLPSNSNDELCHHGVKGQKWGVRHEQERMGRKKIGTDQDDEIVKKKRKMDKVQKALIGTAVAAGSIALAAYITKNRKNVKSASASIEGIVNRANVNRAPVNTASIKTFKPGTFNFDTFKPDTFGFDTFKPK
jgi:hypothetical protein